MERFDDFALAGLFLGGGVLVSVLLRSGDTSSPIRKKSKPPRSAPARDVELVLDDEVEFELPEVELGARSGLAEAPAASAPRLQVASSTPRKNAGTKRPASLSPVQAVEDDEIASLQKALVHYVDGGDLHGQGEVLRRLGHTAKSRGHLRESQGFYMKARDCFQKIGDHYAEAAVLLDLGQVLESLDEHDAASAAYRDANRALLDVAMNSGDRYNDVQANAAD
jgi:tetratricopeptide (TPR) repeat protein